MHLARVSLSSKVQIKRSSSHNVCLCMDVCGEDVCEPQSCGWPVVVGRSTLALVCPSQAVGGRLAGARARARVVRCVG